MQGGGDGQGGGGSDILSFLVHLSASLSGVNFTAYKKGLSVSTPGHNLKDSSFHSFHGKYVNNLEGHNYTHKHTASHSLCPHYGSCSESYVSQTASFSRVFVDLFHTQSNLTDFIESVN